MPKYFLTDEEVAALEQAPQGPPEFIPDEPSGTPAPAQAGLFSAAPTRPAPSVDPSKVRSPAISGALQSLSFGLVDEGAARLSALFGGDPSIGLELPQETYAERRDAALEYYRNRYKESEAAGPKRYLAGSLLGGALSPGGAPQTLRGLALSGAVRGGLAGFGASEGDLGESVRDAATGAVVGGIAAPAIKLGVDAVAAPLARTANALREGAGYALSRVAGGIQRDVRPVGGARAFAQAGLQGFETRGADGQRLINPFDVFPGAAARQEARVADFAARSTDAISNAVDDAGARIPVGPLQQAIQQASAELRQFPSANAGPLARVDGLIDDLGAQADAAGNVTARTLQTAKKTIDDLIKTWDPTGRSSLAQGLQKSIYGAVRDAQEQAVEASAGAGGRAAYESAKQASQLAQRLEQFEASAAARRANQLASVGGLTNKGAGIAGIYQALQGDPVSGLALYAGSRVLASPNTYALGGLAASSMARALPRFAASRFNPILARSAAQEFAREGAR